MRNFGVHFDQLSVIDIGTKPGLDRFEVSPNCYASIAELPEAPDVAAFCVGHARVLDPLIVAAERGVKGAVIYDGGFGERDGEGRRLQTKIEEICRDDSYGRIEPETGRSIGFSARGAIPRLGSVPAKRHVGSEVFNTRTDALACLFTYYMTRMRPIPGGPRRSEPMMPIRQLEALMWAQACEAMDRADRLHRQFFHRAHATPCWEAPCDIFETDEVLTVVIALPGVELDQVKVTLSAGVLIVSAERSLPREVRNARIHRLEIPHGHFERRIELPPTLFEISSRHLANGCLMLQLHKL